MTLRYPPYVAGGYELLTRDAVEGLRARGHEVVVLTGRGARLAEEEGVRAWLTPPLDGALDPLQASLTAGNGERFRLHFFSPANHRATRRALGEVRPDALLFFNLGLVSLAPLIAARLAGVPTLGYLADPWPANHWVLGWRANVARGEGKTLRLALLERGWRSFRDTVGLGPLCVCSDHLRRSLAAEGIPARDMTVVPPGLDPEVLAATATPPSPRAAGEPLRVLCTSSLWEGKGQDVLLAALHAARGEGAPIEVVLAGGGEEGYRARLAAEVARRGLGDAVRFAGWLPRSDLEAETRRAHVLVLPSLWGEPFGLATIEGQAHGLAVVASDAGASPELVEDGVDGLLVPAGDAEVLAGALLGLLADEEGRGRLGATARERVRARFTRERFAADLEAALVTATRAGR